MAEIRKNETNTNTEETMKYRGLQLQTGEKRNTEK
jgi:hypothetical protein